MADITDDAGADQAPEDTRFLRRLWNTGIGQRYKSSTDDDRARIERDTAEYLERGGEITVADDDYQCQPPWSTNQAYRRIREDQTK